MDGKRTNKNKRPTPSGDVPIESADEVVDYGVYKGECYEGEELQQDGKPFQWTCDATTLKFLKEYFKPSFLSSVGNNVVLIERLTRAFFMYCLGTFFLSNANNYIYVGWLASFENVKDVGDYDWGVYAFAYLYISPNFSSRNMKLLNGPIQTLEFWGYEYLGICRPSPNLPKDTDPNTIWPGEKKKRNTFVIVTPSIALEGLIADNVTWHPWASSRTLLDYDGVLMDLVLSKRRVGFGHLIKSIQYLGDRCWRKNHPLFYIFNNPPQKEYLYADREIVENQLGDNVWPDATDFVNKVSYDVDMEYWQQVRSFGVTVGTVD
ncbi:protein MAINTENANCE OF MERISTEMS-like [Papaver somniferum]|uniref:protein MAINTENANCE OF MERISTEMS-like n=1 Tax=Papaver somniferum TaxID=3469 RepID=UPI000E6FCACD|nr:protein MAINTENANCE OF MERISTEMS-like [Papaver somniferum]